MKIHLKMVGCRLNQSEIDTMARQFATLGHNITHSPEEADHLVLNTCAVTREAAKTSRKLIREFHRANPSAETTVTGCYAQLAPQDLQKLPGVRRILSNLDKEHLVSQITGQTIPIYDSEPLERQTAPGALGKTRAFVKVQDGCDNACTFCVTTIARGPAKSRPIAAVLREIHSLQQSGWQEIVLTGVHLGSYGHDLGDRAGLTHLVEALLKDSDMPRLRLSSLEPWDLSDDFFDLWENPRLCRHLHLPLQSGCDATLKRMRRHTSQQNFRHLTSIARAKIPQLRLTTDVIVGFPGETDAEFADSQAFIREMDFAGLHVFRYSPRPSTPASRMKNQVSATIKKERSAKLLALSDQMTQTFAAKLKDTRQAVLWERISGASPQGCIHSGYSDNYMRVKTVHPRNLTNRITNTQLGHYTNGAIHGTVLED